MLCPLIKSTFFVLSEKDHYTPSCVESLQHIMINLRTQVSLNVAIHEISAFDEEI